MAQAILLDTNVLSELMRPQPDVPRQVFEEAAVFWERREKLKA